MKPVQIPKQTLSSIAMSSNSFIRRGPDCQKHVHPTWQSLPHHSILASTSRTNLSNGQKGTHKMALKSIQRSTAEKSIMPDCGIQ